MLEVSKNKKNQINSLEIKYTYFISKYFLSCASKLLWFANCFFKILQIHDYLCDPESS